MLPVYEIRDQLIAAMRDRGRCVLTAPTGSGKTTQVPRMLHDAGIVAGRIVVLQPRRLATRLVARRVAHEMNVELGGRVGYQTRHDRQVSDDSKIVFMTNGLFLRLLQSDPQLRGIGTVVIDELHERDLAADLALALTARLGRGDRPELKLMAMSATLETAKVAAYLDCPVLEAGGRAYPVDIRYLAKRPSGRPWQTAAEVVARLVEADQPGDVLVFMPGMYEIRRTIEACRRRIAGGADVKLLPLHASLPAAEQDAALAEAPGRKIIVSTNVAETSITIEGIRHVVDSGLAKAHHFDANRAINVLSTEPISQASADQRAGRAGRTSPGTCTRLWIERDHKHRPAHDEPEVRRLDLAEPALQMKSMGVADVRGFDWLDRPEDEALDHATALLERLGAIDDAGELTERGRAMAKLPMHPRLGRMIVEAADRGDAGRACLWAALVSGRGLLTGPPAARFTSRASDQPASDLVVHERAFAAAKDARFRTNACREIGVHALTAREADQTCRLMLRAAKSAGLHTRGEPLPTHAMVECLLAGYGDHVAARRDEATLHCAMVGRKRVVLDKQSVATGSPLIVALDVREIAHAGGVRTVLSLASETDLDTLASLFPDRVATDVELRWNADRRAVEQVERWVYDGLTVDETARPAEPGEAAAAMLVDRIEPGEIELPHWNAKVDAWLARTRCVAEWFPQRGLLRYTPDELRVILLEIVAGATRASELRDRPVLPAMRNAMSWEDQQFVERMTPNEIELPSGRPMKIAYEPGSPPKGRAKIQELYGLTDTPRIAGGRQPVLLEILAPNFRPVQMTDDLAGFWKNLYPEVKKELKRRYPKHEWR